MLDGAHEDIILEQRGNILAPHPSFPTLVHLSLNMTTERKQSIYDLEAKREQLAGKSGVAGLFANSRLFFLAFVSLLAALNYGYEQGACE